MSFSNTFKNGLFEINERNFNEKALDLFNYQAKNNVVYKNYLQLLKTDPASITDISKIPYLPILFFKNQQVITGNDLHEVVFYSSGTTGENRSNHYIKDLSFYNKVAEKIFEKFYGKLSDYVILALLPSYLENKSSSLIYMINHFISKTNSDLSGFVLENSSKIDHKINQARRENKKIILWGVSYALLDLAEHSPMDLSDTIVLETGGMKGRREEMTRENLHRILKEKFNVANIHSEYGMTELLSQGYSKGNGIFEVPAWMKILTREIHDPFSINSGKGRGGINVIDLANVDSCAFIETQDIGMVSENDKFEVLGRFDNSDIRGCNLLYLH